MSPCVILKGVSTRKNKKLSLKRLFHSTILVKGLQNPILCFTAVIYLKKKKKTLRTIYSSSSDHTHSLVINRKSSLLLADNFQ